MGREAGPAARASDGGQQQETVKKTNFRAADWTTEKRCSIRREDLGELQKVLDGKKSQPPQDPQMPDGGNDKVWALNRQTETALDTLAILYQRFERVNSDLANVDKQFDKGCEEVQDAMEKVSGTQESMEISAQSST